MAIIAIVVIIVLIYFFVIKDQGNSGGGGGDNSNNNKRATLESHPFMGPVPFINSRITGRSEQVVGAVARLARERVHLPQMNA